MSYKQKKSVTLMELLIAIFLLGMVVITSVTVELAMRRMQTAPTDEVKLLDEMIPVIERIEKDFQRQIGTVYNSSLSIENAGKTVVIRVDSETSGTFGQLDATDPWHSYYWPGSGDYSIYYSPNNSSSIEILARDIDNFSASAALNNTAITVTMQNKRTQGQPENPITNPTANLTTTIYSRMTSGM